MVQEGPCGETQTHTHAAHPPVRLEFVVRPLRDDARNPWTAEPRIQRLELDDGLVSASLGPFGPCVFRHKLDENRRRYLRRTSA